MNYEIAFNVVVALAALGSVLDKEVSDWWRVVAFLLFWWCLIDATKAVLA